MAAGSREAGAAAGAAAPGDGPRGGLLRRPPRLPPPRLERARARRSRRHDLPHAGVPQALLGGVRRGARTPPAWRSARRTAARRWRRRPSSGSERRSASSVARRSPITWGRWGAPALAAAFSERLWAGLLARDDWREADLRGLPEDSAWLPASATRPRAQGLAVEEAEDQNGVAPLLDLPPTWDEYLAQIPSKLRHEIRRKAKKLEAETGPFRDRDRDRGDAAAAPRPVRRVCTG